MEGKVYHGSPHEGITELKRNVSTHGKLCVYATDNEAVALEFMGRGNGDLDTVKALDNGKAVLVERRPGILKKLYDKSGYLYEIDGKDFEHYDYLWNAEVISFQDEKVEKCIKIDNILEALNEKEKENRIKIYRYPDRPKEVPLDNSDLIEKYERFEKSGITGSLDSLLKIYPEFADRINNYQEEPKHIK